MRALIKSELTGLVLTNEAELNKNLGKKRNGCGNIDNHASEAPVIAHNSNLSILNPSFYALTNTLAMRIPIQQRLLFILCRRRSSVPSVHAIMLCNEYDIEKYADIPQRQLDQISRNA